MAAHVTLQWSGEALKRRTRDGLMRAADGAIAVARADLQQFTPVDTGRLARSMDAQREVSGPHIGIRFGALNDAPDYAIFVEAGTRYMAGRFPIRRTADHLAAVFGDLVRSSIR